MGSEERSLPQRFTAILILPHQFVDLSKFFLLSLAGKQKNAPFLSRLKSSVKPLWIYDMASGL